MTDAQLLRRLLQFAEGHEMQLPSLVSSAADLKKLSRARSRLVEMRSALKKQLASCRRDVCDTAFLEQS